jgi:hypothetical protein
MEPEEWLEIAARISRIWPNQPIQDDTAAEWYRLLADLDAAQVDSTISVLAMTERFPPPAGVIRSKLAELALDAPEWGAVWAEIQAAIRAIGFYGVLAEGKLKGSIQQPGGGYDEFVWSSPLVEELVRLVGWQELCTYDIEQERTFEAQVRNKYLSLAERAKQDKAWAGIPASGLPRLEATADRRRLSSGIRIAEVLKQLPGFKP